MNGFMSTLLDPKSIVCACHKNFQEFAHFQCRSILAPSSWEGNSCCIHFYFLKIWVKCLDKHKIRGKFVILLPQHPVAQKGRETVNLSIHFAACWWSREIFWKNRHLKVKQFVPVFAGNGWQLIFKTGDTFMPKNGFSRFFFLRVSKLRV